MTRCYICNEPVIPDAPHSCVEAMARRADRAEFELKKLMKETVVPLQEELHKVNQEVASLRSQVAKLNEDHHQVVDECQQRDAAISGYEQELQDRDKVIKQLNGLIDSMRRDRIKEQEPVVGHVNVAPYDPHFEREHRWFMEGLEMQRKEREERRQRSRDPLPARVALSNGALVSLLGVIFGGTTGFACVSAMANCTYIEAAPYLGFVALIACGFSIARAIDYITGDK